MLKRLPIILPIIMSISLIGIIVVQGYWIISGIKDREAQFSFAIKQALASSAQEIQNIEVDAYFKDFIAAQDGAGDDASIEALKKALISKRNLEMDDAIRYGKSPTADPFKLDPSFLDNDLDSVAFASFLNSKEAVTDNTTKKDARSVNEMLLSELSSLELYERKQIGEWINQYALTIPLTSRISNSQVQTVLKKELDKRELSEPFEFAVYQDGFATRIQSENFNFNTDATWSYPLFKTGLRTVSPYTLYVNIPGRIKYILSSLMFMISLSLVFTSVIVIAYIYANVQIVKQQEISEIKTDFINNMTHEFKTPIATINLALDALKHPKIMGNDEKVTYYHKLIREENKRMHSQVENVLRISQLEQSTLNIELSPTDLDVILQESISHVQLILQQKSGVIHYYPGALNTIVDVHDAHMTNVFVNILENAIKYTDDAIAPEIDVFTENIKDKIVIKVRDNGIGMSKVAQKKAFIKFFREHTGNVHNVKGHGLGLAYAHRIVEHHRGTIVIDSIKGNGSTFSIELPTVN